MTNEPAFPVFPETSGGHAAAFTGMTLRDYFAAKALDHPYSYHDSDPAKVAEWAYVIADAMMEARK